MLFLRGRIRSVDKVSNPAELVQGYRYALTIDFEDPLPAGLEAPPPMMLSQETYAQMLLAQAGEVTGRLCRITYVPGQWMQLDWQFDFVSVAPPAASGLNWRN